MVWCVRFQKRVGRSAANAFEAVAIAIAVSAGKT
jgi:hypothetical protein